MEGVFKVMWLTRSTGILRTFEFTSWHDDPQNGRVIFTDEEYDKVLTLFYDDVGYMITSPLKKNKE